MKIYGIGTDIVSVDRFKKSLKNKNFIKRLFNKDEVIKCSKLINSNNCYAKRFAAKEAFSKALRTGISGGIAFKEISINSTKKGSPYIELLGKTKSIVKRTIKKKYKIFLTMSDEQKYAIATVVITY
jgi:holo-[acyl-carrier protein] synthase